MRVSAVHVSASILAFLVQVLGAFLVIRESARLRRSELNELGLIGKFRAEVKRTILNPAPADLGRIHAGAGASASAVVTTPRAPGTPEEGLQRRVSELEDEIRVVREGLSSETQTLRARTEALEIGLDEQISEWAEKRRSDFERAIHGQVLGTGLIVVGVGLDLVANLVS